MATSRGQISPDSRNNVLYWLILAAIILFAAVVRLRLLSFPLERDEGEYAYVGQLILQGIPPFSQAYSMKLPGTGLSYAVIMLLFGQSAKGIHLGLLLVNCLSILLLFFVVKRLANPTAGLVAALSYAVLSLSPGVLGFAAHASHFIVLTSLAGILLLLKGFERSSLTCLFMSGLLFGLSFLMKQHAIFIVLFGICAIFLQSFKSLHITVLGVAWKVTTFIAAAALPYTLLIIYEVIAGNFEKCWFWTYLYAAKYATSTSFETAFNEFKANYYRVIFAFKTLWIIAGIGIIVIFIDKRIKNYILFVSAFVFFSFLAVCPGFYFREHYFIVFLPATSLLIGLSIDFFCYRVRKYSKILGYVPIALFIAAIAMGLYTERNYFFFEKPINISRMIYGSNPFPEAIKIAKYVKSNTNAGDKIAVLGSEPEIYFYSQRLGSTGYIYTYGLMEEHDYSLTMQKEMIHEIEAAAPKYIIFVKIYHSWLIRPNSERLIFNWLDQYLINYELVGNIDIVSLQETKYIWGEQAGEYKNKSDSFILIFKRK